MQVRASGSPLQRDPPRIQGELRRNLETVLSAHSPFSLLNICTVAHEVYRHSCVLHVCFCVHVCMHVCV